MIQQFPELSLWSLWCIFTEPAYLGPQESLPPGPLLLWTPIVMYRHRCAHPKSIRCAYYTWKAFIFPVTSNCIDHELDGVASVSAPYHLRVADFRLINPDPAAGFLSLCSFCACPDLESTSHRYLLYGTGGAPEEAKFQYVGFCLLERTPQMLPLGLIIGSSLPCHYKITEWL